MVGLEGARKPNISFLHQQKDHNIFENLLYVAGNMVTVSNTRMYYACTCMGVPLDFYGITI